MLVMTHSHGGQGTGQFMIIFPFPTANIDPCAIFLPRQGQRMRSAAALKRRRTAGGHRYVRSIVLIELNWRITRITRLDDDDDDSTHKSYCLGRSLCTAFVCCTCSRIRSFLEVSVSQKTLCSAAGLRCTLQRVLHQRDDNVLIRNRFLTRSG